MTQPLRCRWGILGSGREATRFISDVQASEKSKATILPIQHSITALAAAQEHSDTSTSSIEEFAREHFGQESSTSAPSSTSATLLSSVASSPSPSTRPQSAHAASIAFPSASKHAQPSPAPTTGPVVLSSASVLFNSSNIVDAVLIDSSPASQMAHAREALQAGFAVLLVRPLTLSATDGRELVDIAKSKKVWLAIMMKESKRDKASLRWVADECARCRERALCESPQVAWEDNIAILEALDELREIIRPTNAEQPAPMATFPSIGEPDRVEQPNASHAEVAEVAVPQENGAIDAASSTSETHFPHTEDQGEEEDIDLAPRRFPRTPRPSGPLPDLTETPEEGDASASMSQDSIVEKPRKRRSSRPTSRLSAGSERSSILDSPTLGMKQLDEPSQVPLRSQIHELKHLLRQKNAQITALQQQQQSGPSSGPLSLSTGLSNKKSAVRISMPAQGYNGVPPVRPPRRRTSSTSSDGAFARGPSPLSSRSPQPGKGRRGSNANEALGEADANQLASNGEAQSPGHDEDFASSPRRPEGSAGFLAPTKASQQRRIATLTQQANGIAHRTLSNASSTGSPNASESKAQSGHTGQVISHLTKELEETQSALEATKAKLATSQRNLATLQKSYDSAKDSLYHSRVEFDRSVTAAARKDRQHAEVLERARKAETEARELGRASREWGTRVRQVEGELGEVRRQQAKAEAGYEAIASAWKRTRDHWEAEVHGLRKQLADVITEHREKARSALEKFETVEHEWKGREGERKGLEAVLEGLKQERGKAKVEVVKMVDDLVVRLEAHEKSKESQDAKVNEVQSELTRILRLMRDGVVDPQTIETRAHVKK
ncbi:unnamed protein product [Sympodiomycopsis kandeliae]